MTNKDKIKEVTNNLGLKIGSWNAKMESLSSNELKKVLGNVEYESDTDVLIKRKIHVVEIDIVDDEVDFSVLTKEQYINRYGDERWDN